MKSGNFVFPWLLPSIGGHLEKGVILAMNAQNLRRDDITWIVTA